MKQHEPWTDLQAIERVRAGDAQMFELIMRRHNERICVIGAVRDVLVPGAQNAELKTLLQNAIPTLEGHLQHAKMVQQQLGKHASR